VTLRVALVAGDGSTCIRATDGRTILELPGRARFVAWDRRGAQLAVVSDDGFVRVLSAATGEEQARIKAADTDKVMFSATGKGAILINTFISARWFQWGDGKPRSRALPAAGDAVFSRNGRVFVPYSNDEDASGVWDARTGKRTAAFHHDGGIQTIAVSPDGKLVLSGGNDGRALLWSSTDGDRLAVLPHQGPVVQAALSSSGAYAATLGADQVARVWSLPEGREIGRIRYEGSAITLSFTPDDQLLFIASANWAHLFRIESEIIPYASRRLLGRWSGEYRFLERDGSRLLALTSTGELGYQANVIRFDIVAAEPVNRMPSLEAWEQRTALRFEGEELVPRALARAVVPIVQPAAAGRTPQPESEPAL